MRSRALACDIRTRVNSIKTMNNEGPVVDPPDSQLCTTFIYFLLIFLIKRVILWLSATAIRLRSYVDVSIRRGKEETEERSEEERKGKEEGRGAMVNCETRKLAGRQRKGLKEGGKGKG